MKRLGIIGGMGPMATIDLYKKITDLTDAKKDQDHIHIIIDSYPQIEDRTAHIINGEKSPLPRLLETAKRLAAAGADALLMPCNTAHYFADDIVKEINVPLIHMIKCAAEAIKNNYPKTKKIALFATTGTRRAGVYDKIFSVYGFETVQFPQALENDIMACIYDGVKAGKIAEYVPLFQKCVDEASLMGVDVMAAGCTEIPLLLPHIKTNTPFVDATTELAKAAVKFALGK